jgi:hypothetical protein
MERRGLRQRLRHRIGGPARVAPVLLRGGFVLPVFVFPVDVAADTDKFTCADVVTDVEVGEPVQTRRRGGAATDDFVTCAESSSA